DREARPRALAEAPRGRRRARHAGEHGRPGHERRAARGAPEGRARPAPAAWRDPGDRHAREVFADASRRAAAGADAGRAHRRGADRVWLLRRRHPGAPREEGRPVGREGLTRHRGLALLLAAGCLSATPGLAALYKWTDTAGVVYYTSDLASIPPAFRDSATPISTPQARPAQPAKSEPAALRVTAGAPLTAERRLNE